LLLPSYIHDIFAAEDHPFRYAFMFPTVMAVSITCQSAGIGGAALLSPILLLIFPLLGPEYPLQTAAAAIASALLTECFGFLSGLSGYWRRGLVDWGVAFKFLGLALPTSFAGALLEPSLAGETTFLRILYSTLMLTLCAFLLFSEKPVALSEECDFSTQEDPIIRTKTAVDGTVFTYLEPDKLTWKTIGATTAGASLTGLLGVGIGEVILPQLVRISCMPLPVAAGTSVAVVVLTALTAATVQFSVLANELMILSPDLTLQAALGQVVPWNLVQYTVPGAVVGGQVAPYLASKRVLDDETIESIVAALFGIIGVAFAAKVVLSG
jgi:hypothetical protein